MAWSALSCTSGKDAVHGCTSGCRSGDAPGTYSWPFTGTPPRSSWWCQYALALVFAAKIPSRRVHDVRLPSRWWFTTGFSTQALPTPRKGHCGYPTLWALGCFCMYYSSVVW